MVVQPSPVHPRQRCPALQLLQRAGADFTDWPPLQRPLAANPSSQRIDEQLGTDHHRQALEHKPLTVERWLGRPVAMAVSLQGGLGFCS